jgi:hypothetical protein
MVDHYFQVETFQSNAPLVEILIFHYQQGQSSIDVSANKIK